MNKSFIILVLTTTMNLNAQVRFNEYFTDEALRIDYFHTGNADQETFALDKIYRYNKWAGNPNHCIQNSQVGDYRIEVYNAVNNNLIYSKGYNSIFFEYQTTQPAHDGINKTCHESVWIPNPKNPVICKITKREKDQKFNAIYSFEIDPGDYHIHNEKPASLDGVIVNSIKSGDPHFKVDLVIVGEGYTDQDEEKFRKDLDYYITLFLNTEPYKSHKDEFNITGIMPFSDEGGPDEPRKGIYKNTALNSSFNLFDLERYMLIEDNKTLQDVACSVPFDALLIMVNTSRYGGGAIYNFQTVFSSDNPKKEYVFLHELGHGLTGLADEYYSSSVAYVDFYPSGVEPPEPNITALLNPDSVKWLDLLSPGIEIPTKWGKELFDSLNIAAYKLRMAKEDTLNFLYNTSVSEEVINSVILHYDKKIEAFIDEIESFIRNHPLKDEVGVFEGAGYQSHGLYRPTLYSMMHGFDKENISYGPVNERAILKIIRYYTDQE
ncbi:MAG: peptidase M64 [Bacteroidales bacterium]|nr:peptidase M64 [Bacteroidales bacterium]